MEATVGAGVSIQVTKEMLWAHYFVPTDGLRVP